MSYESVCVWWNCCLLFLFHERERVVCSVDITRMYSSSHMTRTGDQAILWLMVVDAFVSGQYIGIVLLKGVLFLKTILFAHFPLVLAEEMSLIKSVLSCDPLKCLTM